MLTSHYLTMSNTTQTIAAEPGFSVTHGADWSKYMTFRPL